MAEQSSLHTSTLSQAFATSLLFYMGMMLLVAYGLIWKSLDVEIAKLIIGWASALEAALMAAYLTARSVQGNGKEEPPKPPEEVKPDA